MAFDLDNEELKATRKLHNQDDGLYEETSDKDVENEERLNNFIEAYKQTKEQSFIVDSINKDFFFEFVDCLLAELEQKDKRIQELDEQVKMLDEAYTGTIKESKKWFDIAHNSIPTQVVLDKIDELGISDEDINIKYVLQELLGGKK